MVEERGEKLKGKRQERKKGKAIRISTIAP